MAAAAESDELSGLPIMLKVEEAARVLRIGRTLAYELAARFQAGDATGLPVVRLGSCLRVPRWALAELIRHGRVISDLDAGVDDLIAAQALTEPQSPQPKRSRSLASGAQLSLLGLD